jgi:hypothetical protein
LLWFFFILGCGDVPEIENGAIVSDGKHSLFGSQANVTCDPGFTADPSYITCQTSGEWGNVTCIRIGTLTTISIYTFVVFVK